MKKHKYIICIVLFLLFPSIAMAANHYIRAGASGNNSGSDWTNAMNDLPSSFIRGDTYYVADGDYGTHIFATPVSGSLYIYIKKATEANHGTDVGWNNSYGDGVAHFSTSSSESVLTITTDRWVFDGQVGGGPGSWGSGHGFKVSSLSLNPGKGINIADMASYLEIRHVEIDLSASFYSGNGGDGIYIQGSGSGLFEYINVSHCYVHDVDRVHVMLNYSRNCTFEYNWFNRRRTQPGGPHGESFSCNFNAENTQNTIRYNRFSDVAGTGYIVIKSPNADGGDSQGYWHIYGNLFFETESWAMASNGTICDTSHERSVDYSNIHNNTFVNMKGGVGIKFQQGGNNLAYNNLFYNCEGSSMFVSGTTTHDYSWFYNSGTNFESHGQNGSANPFIDIENLDFRLASATSTGMQLNEPYNRDTCSNTRGADGVWDRGAFEYGGIYTCDEPPLAPPFNLRIASE